MNPNWGTREWFESMFDSSKHPTTDGWKTAFRGSQKFRHDLYIKVLKRLLSKGKKIQVLDIGCALGDLTGKVWKLNQINEIYGIDISKNAMIRASRKYPEFEFIVGSLPILPFRGNSFDLILCLEVLYYLPFKKRIRSLENIRKTLKPESYLLFSGVLDGGIRYFAEDQILGLISRFFQIETIVYNYAKIYTEIERPLLHLLSICNGIERYSNMMHTEDFEKLHRESAGEPKVESERIFMKILNCLLFGQIIARIIGKFVSKIVISIFSSKVLVGLSYGLTKFLLGRKGKTHIIILAKKT